MFVLIVIFTSWSELHSNNAKEIFMETIFKPLAKESIVSIVNFFTSRGLARLST